MTTPPLLLAALPLLLAPAPPPSPAPGSQPLFVENRGQWDVAAGFVARTSSGCVRLERGALRVQLHDPHAPRTGVLVGLELPGRVAPRGRERARAVHHYFLGRGSASRHLDVPTWSQALFPAVLPGIDVVVHADGGPLEYDLVVSPGAELDAFTIRATGVDGLSKGTDGALDLETPLGVVRQHAPVAWYEDGAGRREQVSCRFVVRGERSFGFHVPDRDATRRLVIDPRVVWSTYLGGSGFESAYAAHVDDAGDVTVVGQTGSMDFPTTPGAFSTSFSGPAFSDAFVSRLDATGALLWSTYLGGLSGEEARAVHAGANGSVLVAGVTSSGNFPTTPGAFSSQASGSSEAFVTKLGPAGDVLVFSTLLGGSGGDVVRGVVPTAEGDPVVVGTTDSGDFPTTPGAFDRTLGGGSDAFAARLDASGNGLVFSTFLGGGDGDTGMDVAVDGSGGVVAAGTTSSADFPATPGAYDDSLDGNSDAWIARLDPGGGTLVLASLLGGTDGDSGEGVALAPDGGALVCGTTSSADFPTSAGAFSSTAAGSSDAFVARFTPSGDGLVFSTLVGGDGGDVAFDVHLDRKERPIVGGVTSSSDFPTTPGAFDRTASGSSDAFLLYLSATASSLAYSTLVGGSSGDVGEASGANAAGEAVVSGTTSSSDFPTTPGAADTTYSSPSESFATRLEPSRRRLFRLVRPR